MNAREKILTRIRTAQGRSGADPSEAEMAQVRANIAQRHIGPQPSISRPPDLLVRFRSECDRLGTTHVHLESAADIPQAVAKYLQANGLAMRVVLWPEWAVFDWRAAGIEAEARPATGSDATGITGCFCALAETGTLLLLGSPEQPKTVALLPETHIAIVSRGRLVATMEEAFAMLRRERGQLPRATWFVSGPSRTADIEQTIVIGAHGPYRVHVILVP
jgi:L-lactate dehydrogenase complex protein LldG